LIVSKYAEQAKWYLNGFWKDGAEQEAENVWNFTQGFIKFDEKKASGNELDEFWSHKFLESIGETLTVLEVHLICFYDSFMFQPIYILIPFFSPKTKLLHS
jgi:hypothetical protein